MDKRKTVGVMIGNANSPYSTALMKGIMKAAEEKDVNLLFYLGIHSDSAYRLNFGSDAADDFEYQFNVVYDYIDISNVDGLILSYGTVKHFLGGMTKESLYEIFQGIPHIMIEEPDETGEGSSVIADNYVGMFELVEHLVVEHGYKKFVYLSGPKGMDDADQRRHAFMDVMKKYNLPAEPSQIAYGDYSAYVEKQVTKLLDENPDAEVCVCANDLMADCVYKICRKRGKKVGIDMAVTGFDDWENADYMIPPLTTILQDARKMGEIALEGVYKLLQGEKPQIFKVSATPVYRTSCGCRKFRLKELPIVKEDMYWMEGHTAEDERYMYMSRAVKAAQERFDTYKQETWFLPLISREMMNHVDDEEEFFRKAMSRMGAFRIRKSYLFLLEHPIMHQDNDNWVCPDTLHLASYQEEGDVVSYPVNERPMVNRQKGISDFIDRDSRYCMQTFILFSGEMQYGILVTEITPEDMALCYLASMQISNALRFIEIANEQKRTRRKLEKLISEINEKNEVLNFISEYDDMTNCLNRRGFMEAVMEMNKNNLGKRAAFIFADVDHLKEINDSFGHIEGDYAISRIATVLSKAVENKGFVGRIGGDEFVAMILENENEADSIVNYVKERNHYFNVSDEKEYYIEASFGIQSFICSDDISISELLDGADVELYRSKKNRRKTVRKD